VKRELTIAVAGAAILVAGISGCSSSKPSGGGIATSVPGGSVSVAGRMRRKSSLTARTRMFRHHRLHQDSRQYHHCGRGEQHRN